MKSVKIVLILVLVVLALLVLTNPTLKDFKEFLPSDTPYSKMYFEKAPGIKVARESNYLICSVYYISDRELYQDQKVGEKRYLGLFKGFYLIE